MAEELLDYSGKTFSFVYADFVRAEQKITFERDCEGIRDSAKKVVADFCVLGKRLALLKASNAWQNVLDQNGERFGVDNFTDFCYYVFGFSPTKTSNFLGLAQFVIDKDGETVLDEKYEGFSTSKLIELSSTYAFQRDYFLPTWTVKEIRLVKNYLKIHSVSGQTPESLLKAALALEEKRAQAKQAGKQAEQQSLLETKTPEKKDEPQKLEDWHVHNFLSIFEPYDGHRRRVCQFLDQRLTSEALGEVLRKELGFGDFFKGDYVASWDADGFTLRHRPYGTERFMTWQAFALEYSIAQTFGKFGTEGQREAWFKDVEGETPAVSDVGNEDETDVEEQFDVVDAETVDDVSTEEEAAPAPVEDERYNLKSRAGRREWLNDYKNWEPVEDPKRICLCASSVYQYVVRALDLVIFAVENRSMNSVFSGVATAVYYYASIGDDSAFVDVRKERLEQYVADNIEVL